MGPQSSDFDEMYVLPARNLTMRPILSQPDELGLVSTNRAGSPGFNPNPSSEGQFPANTPAPDSGPSTRDPSLELLERIQRLSHPCSDLADMGPPLWSANSRRDPSPLATVLGPTMWEGRPPRPASTERDPSEADARPSHATPNPASEEAPAPAHTDTRAAGSSRARRPPSPAASGASMSARRLRDRERKRQSCAAPKLHRGERNCDNLR